MWFNRGIPMIGVGELVSKTGRVAVKTGELTEKKMLLVLPVEPRGGKPTNFIRARCAPSRTEIGYFRRPSHENEAQQIITTSEVPRKSKCTNDRRT
jgi:hypothetical protein